MQKIFLLFLLSIVSFSLNLAAEAQSKTLAATMDVYVFPKKGQDTEQQSKDEAECYSWAESNTSSDPFQLQKESGEIAVQAEKDKQKAAQTKKGGGGMVRGAAAGAIIGEIADDDSSKGAAYGAAAGAISQRRKNRAAKAQAVEQAEKDSAHKQATNAEQMVKFKKAFSVCLEAKEYLVKY